MPRRLPEVPGSARCAFIGPGASGGTTNCARLTKSHAGTRSAIDLPCGDSVMTSQRSVVFAEPVRTAIGTFGGTLKDVPAPSLGAVAIKAAVKPAGLRVDEVETV